MQAVGKSGGGRAELVRRGQVRLEEILCDDGGCSRTGMEQKIAIFVTASFRIHGQVKPCELVCIF